MQYNKVKQRLAKWENQGKNFPQENKDEKKNKQLGIQNVLNQAASPRQEWTPNLTLTFYYQLKMKKMISPMSHRSVGQKQHNNSWNLDQKEIFPIGSVEFSQWSPQQHPPGSKGQISRGQVLSHPSVWACHIISHQNSAKTLYR